MDSHPPDEVEDGESDESEEDEEEPKLKYQRLSANVVEILKKDAASCMGIHNKFLAMGTHYGVVHVLDFTGVEIRRMPSHTTTVNALSIDASGEWIASCSDDGKVCIHGLESDESFEYAHPRPMMAVALDPLFGRDTKHHQFACGGREGVLVLNQPAWFGGRKRTELHKGEGPIYSIEWHGPFIAWANDLGVKVYDTERQQRISYIDRPKGAPRADLYRCQMCFMDDWSLLIGWADCIKIGRIRERPADARPRAASSAAVPDRYVEIVAIIQTDYIVSGIAPFGEYLVVLAYLTGPASGSAPGSPTSAAVTATGATNGLSSDGSQAQSRGAHQRPELRIITRSNEEISTDALSLHGWSNYEANDYRLAAVPHEPLFFVVSPKDIVLGRPRDLDDHIDWLVARQRYDEAMQAAEMHPEQLREHSLSALGDTYIGYLLSHGDYAAAARLCPKLAGESADVWHKWLYRFGQLGQYVAIADVIPTSRPRLSDTAYEMVLGYFLNSSSAADHRKFLELVEKWPPVVYNLQNVVTAVERRLQDLGPSAGGGSGLAAPTVEEQPLLVALARLYTFDRQFDKTLNICLKLHASRPVAAVVQPSPQQQPGDESPRGDPVAAAAAGSVSSYDPFVLIRQHGLFDSIKDKVAQLMAYDAEQATALLTAHAERVPPEVVVPQLSEQPRHLYRYLHQLFVKDPQLGKDFHEVQIELYADYDRPQLLPFLRQSEYYSPEKAFRVCQQRQLWPEMVFLMGRMGNTKAALHLLIDKIGDVQQAIEFIEAQQDDELWDDLIEAAMPHAAFVSQLLEHIGAYVDPLKLIKRIPHGLELDRLRDRLVKIISDYNLQMSLREGCKEILKADCVELLQRCTRLQRRAFRVEETESAGRCSICQGAIIGFRAPGIIAFFCHHTFHQSCLLGNEEKDSSTGAPVAKASDQNDVRVFCPICQNLHKARNSRRTMSRIR